MAKKKHVLREAQKNSERAPRNEARMAQTKAPLSATPQEVRKQADRIATLRQRLGGPNLPIISNRTLLAEYDSEAEVQASRLMIAVADEPKLSAATKVTSSRLGLVLGKYRSMNRFRRVAEDVEQAISDSRVLVRRQELRMAKRLLEKGDQQLGRLDASDPRRRGLKAQLDTLRELIDGQENQLYEQAKKTRKAVAEQESTLEDARKRRKLLKALFDMKAGKTVDRSVAAEVLSTFGLHKEDLSKIHAEDRRMPR
jgi:hypothetical protein